MTDNGCFICGRSDCNVVLESAIITETNAIERGVFSGKCNTCGMVLVGGNLYNDFYSGNIDRSLFMGCLKRHSIIREKAGKTSGKLILTEGDLKEGVFVPSTPLEQVDMLIEYIASKQKSLSEFVRFDSSKDYPICFAKNESDFCFIISSAHKLGYIKGRGNDNDPIMDNGGRLYLSNDLLMLTLDGWGKVQELQKQSPYSKQVFVAFNFDKDRKMKGIYDRAVAPAISECGLTPYTTLDDEHGNSITDVIIANIRKSRFIIADVTNSSQNVYYEAGFAYGLGLEVILTCHDESAERDMKFDTSHIKHVLWKDEEDLKAKLINRIEALGLSLKS
ncbi:MAG: hypothetical protein ACOYIS_05015 [Candidatus Cloacimonadaceae bacterium]